MQAVFFFKQITTQFLFVLLITTWFSLQVGFQKILTLTYVDKLIDDVHKEFRDKYRNEFQQKGTLGLLSGTFDFKEDFLRLLR